MLQTNTSGWSLNAPMSVVFELVVDGGGGAGANLLFGDAFNQQVSFAILTPTSTSPGLLNMSDGFGAHTVTFGSAQPYHTALRVVFVFVAANSAVYVNGVHQAPSGPVAYAPHQHHPRPARTRLRDHATPTAPRCGSPPCRRRTSSTSTPPP